MKELAVIRIFGPNVSVKWSLDRVNFKMISATPPTRVLLCLYVSRVVHRSMISATISARGSRSIVSVILQNGYCTSIKGLPQIPNLRSEVALPMMGRLVIWASAYSLVSVEFEAAVEGSSDRSLSPLYDASGKLW